MPRFHTSCHYITRDVDDHLSRGVGKRQVLAIHIPCLSLDDKLRVQSYGRTTNITSMSATMSQKLSRQLHLNLTCPVSFDFALLDTLAAATSCYRWYSIIHTHRLPSPALRTAQLADLLVLSADTLDVVGRDLTVLFTLERFPCFALPLRSHVSVRMLAPTFRDYPASCSLSDDI